MSDVHEDIYQGLANQPAPEKPIIFSLGHRCTSTSLIKELKLKFESYPFDWVVSKLDVIAHCIEDNFVEFLKPENYETKQSETFNMCNGVKREILTENVVYNKYYEDQEGNLPNDIGTFGMKLCMTHHDIRKDEDLQYFQRCVTRFNKILANDQKKYYLYVHPLMGFFDYAQSVEDLKKYLLFFTDYFKGKTKNSFGLYFLLVQDEERKGEVLNIYQDEDCVINVIFANEQLVDGGGVFCGNSWYEEQASVLKTIESYI
jgi:hypothetical protein